MENALQKKIAKLHDGIRKFPDLHTRAFTLGARAYDCMDLIDGKAYYIRISFDVNPANQAVEILTTTAEEVPGPH